MILMLHILYQKHHLDLPKCLVENLMFFIKNPGGVEIAARIIKECNTISCKILGPSGSGKSTLLNTKHVFVPSEYSGKKVLIEFESVYHNAEVYINGTKAAYRPYGYTNFYVDTEGLLKYEAQNEIRHLPSGIPLGR